MLILANIAGGVVAKNEPIEPIPVNNIKASATRANITATTVSQTKKTPIVVAMPFPPLKR